MNAYQQGQLARKNGKTMADNPYAPGETGTIEWMMGFNDEGDKHRPRPAFAERINLSGFIYVDSPDGPKLLGYIGPEPEWPESIDIDRDQP